MNLRLVSRLLASIAWLIGGTMAFSLPWALPACGQTAELEVAGIWGLVISMMLCGLVGFVLRRLGRGADGTLYRKEAMAVVGLSWALATVLGALPFLISGTCRGTDAEGEKIRMNIADCLFESQSGFSTTGATVLTKITVFDEKEPLNEHGFPAIAKRGQLVPRCILFWRSSTHFLGGLGIIVLFVAILGQGSAGKAMMRAEMPGPSKEGSLTRMQHTAWLFAGIYVALNAVLAAILLLEGMSIFDAICHAFGTMATGGFSTYDSSLGYFGKHGYNGPLIEYTVTFFMILAGTNFTLLYLVSIGKPKSLFADIEWRTYMGIILCVTAMIVIFGVWIRRDGEWVHGDFETLGSGIRYGLFQVVSILTTTGYGTHDFDQWNSFGRGVLFLLMFVGGCAGSTGGGLKVIRHILFLKIMRQEIEHAFHPTVVRPLRLGGQPIEDRNLRYNILVYFSLILVIFVFSWLFIVAVEPDITWTHGAPTPEAEQTLQNKLIDSATSVAATLNNIGPGLGTVGATQNYAHFSWWSKLLFTFLMMVGRLEIFAILVLFVPSFWRDR